MCGPGNNGGDGFVAARHLAAFGWDVRVALLGERERLKGDAAEMASGGTVAVAPLDPAVLAGATVVVDALFGAGLTRPLEGRAADIVRRLNSSNVPVVAIDVPSGLHGDLGRGLDDLVVEADLTVTFFRKKPAHVLMPGALRCGEMIVADIGIPEAALEAIKPNLFENGPELWGAAISLATAARPQIRARTLRRGQRSGACHRRGAACGPRRAPHRRRAGQCGEPAGCRPHQCRSTHRHHGEAVRGRRRASPICFRTSGSTRW